MHPSIIDTQELIGMIEVHTGGGVMVEAGGVDVVISQRGLLTVVLIHV
jgi:hypothetical protein